MIRDDWSCSNWCPFVTAGQDRAERGRRLALVPAQWRIEVESHVRVVFGVARKRNQTRTRDGGQSK